MYLSKIDLNIRSSQVQAELNNPYQMHRTISKAFGNDPRAYEEARCLFRVDQPATSAACWILVQSRIEPDWNLLTVNESYLAAPPVVKQFAPDVRRGQRLQFRLRANPTIKKSGKRIGLYKEEEQIAWLKRKATQSGFEIVTVVVSKDDKTNCRLPEDRAAAFCAAQFDGVLTVTDPDHFRNTLESGIGSAKGFGFGLLSVAPVR